VSSRLKRSVRQNYALFEHSSVSSFLLRKIFEICLQRLQLFAGILYGVECAPKLVIRGVLLEIPGYVLTSNPESLALAVKAVQFPNMPYQQTLNLAKWQRGQQFPSVQIMLDFPEDPGSPLSSAAYHQGISPSVVEHCSGFMRVSNVTIRDNRNGNILLNCPNAVVLRVAVEQAGTGSAMNSQGLYTTVFGQLGNLYTVTVFWRPASADLKRYGTSRR
jgi:hypothetical protein